MNITYDLRLDNEVDVQFTNEDLVEKYQSDVLDIIFRNYSVASISLVDATLEDLYEYLIKIYTPDILDSSLEKQIRNAWTNDNLLNFLINPDKVSLQKLNNVQMEFSEVFMRYSELRIVRHTLLHTPGKLSDKNHQKLLDYLDSTLEERRNFALINSPIFIDRDVDLTINHVLSIRQYLYRFLMYLYKSISER